MRELITGEYVELFETKDKNLEVRLTDEGKQYLSEVAKFGMEKRSNMFGTLPDVQTVEFSESYQTIWSELFEDIHCNSTIQIFPENQSSYFGLTTAPIIAFDVEMDDEGEIVESGNFYWFPNYQIESELETLLSEGTVLFIKP